MTLDPSEFRSILEKNGIRFFTGVPDSLLKEFCLEVSERAGDQHVITANEGSAVALASGWHLATGETALVYLQNSGLGNTVNPLVSLADPAVYGVPMLLLIGWRGEPGTKDEPQHVRQGSITLSLLDTLGVPHNICPADAASAEQTVQDLLATARSERRPVALVVPAGTFGTCAVESSRSNDGALSREEAIEEVVARVGSAHVVATTGMISRELFELREKRGERHDRDFLTVGSMGHASAIALGVALAHPDEPVYCFDGDGALLMHAGTVAAIGTAAPKHFRHIVFNNDAHDSVGGQPTAGSHTDFPKLALSCGYTYAASASDADSLARALTELESVTGPALLEVRVRRGARSDLGRPTQTPQESADAFRASFE